MTSRAKVRSQAQRRPTSPHLGIFAVQTTSFLSITHRVSEMLLWLTLLLWAAILVSSAAELCAGACCAWAWPWGIWAASTCLFYHVLGVIRHVAQDWGYGLSARSADLWTLCILSSTALWSLGAAVYILAGASA